jgi:acetolactate synthase I/II/III large subunit
MALMTGSRFFAETMHAYEVTHIFFVPTMLLPAMAEMEDMNIRRIVTHGEKAAAYMADGYARASRKPGICMAQNIGAANLAAGLRDAYMACSPVIAITGGPDSESRYRHFYQEIEDFSMFDPVTKFNARIDKLGRLPDLLRQAFREATSGAPRPVHLEMKGSHGQVIEEEGNLEVIVEGRHKQYPAFRSGPEMDRVGETLTALSRAERPVIVAGGALRLLKRRRKSLSSPSCYRFLWRPRSTAREPLPTIIRWLSESLELTLARAPTERWPKRTWFFSSAAIPAVR